MSGQGSGSSSSMQVPSLPGVYQPMDCESSPRHSVNRRNPTLYPSTPPTTDVPTTAPMSLQSMDNTRLQSSLGTYNSLILPGMGHLPGIMTSPMIPQQNYYNYGYTSNDGHVRQPATGTTTKQRDPEREDSPMVGVCVQQSPVAIH